MAWMAKHLFLREQDQKRAALHLHDLLKARPPSTDQTLVEGDPPPILLSAPFSNWLAITCISTWFEDLDSTAQKLSESLATVSASCEVLGNCYRLRLKVFDRGEEVRAIQTPQSGWNPKEDPEKHMPLYEDVEQIAYQALRDSSVPASLITIGTCPLGINAKNIISQPPGITFYQSENSLEQGTQEYNLHPFEGEAAPVLPSSVCRDFGVALFEDRYVEGCPTAASLDRLLHIEEAILSRAQNAEPERQVSLTVTYYTGQFQAKLDQMLVERGRPTAPASPRDRPPWWQFWRYFGRVR